jgi:hypothetical protein
VAVVALTTTSAVGRTTTPSTTELTQTFARIEHQPVYRRSTWGYDVLDQRTGKVLASHNDQQMFRPRGRR